MIDLEALLREIGALDAAELTRWIESGWVRPEGEEDAGSSTRSTSRVRLIVRDPPRARDRRQAIPVVLSLLDQIYGVRRELPPHAARWRAARSGAPGVAALRGARRRLIA
jgi:chaperone modulatory protein CbpM